MNFEKSFALLLFDQAEVEVKVLKVCPARLQVLSPWQALACGF
jgi:hypothetical protein